MTVFTDAIVALASPNVQRIYLPNEVPHKPTYPYVVVDVILGAADGYRLCAAHGFRWCEVVAQAFGHTTGAAADVMELFVSSVLDQSPPVVGWDTSPAQMEISPTEADDRDDVGVYGLTALLTFTASKESA